MSYKVKKGSIIIAIQQDGQSVAKTATREKIYQEALYDEEGEFYIFQIAPGGLYRELRVMKVDVELPKEFTSIPDGTYTIVRPAEEKHITIRLLTSKNEKNEDGRANFFFGKQVISYLNGPDNENNFQGFAHLDETGGVHVWKRFKDSPAIQKYEHALSILYELGGEGQSAAGLEYAMRSGRCMKCNRTLTVPASLHIGMGPICAIGGEDK